MCTQIVQCFGTHSFLCSEEEGAAGRAAMEAAKVNRARHTVFRLNAKILVLYAMWFKMRLIWKNFPIYRIRNGWEWNAHFAFALVYSHTEKNDIHKLVPFCSILSFSFAIVFIYFRRHLFKGKLLFRSNLIQRNWIYHRHHRPFCFVTSCFMTFQSLSLFLHCDEFQWKLIWVLSSVFTNIQCELYAGRRGMAEKPIMKFYWND